MITIYDMANRSYVIRPCPLININRNNITNSNGSVGANYEITLTGKLLAHAGSPIFSTFNQPALISQQYYPANTQESKPAETANEIIQYRELNSILEKQIALKELFSKNCYKMEVCSIKTGETEAVITCFPKLVSINFSEGTWVQSCDYSITLEAPFLLDRNDKIIGLENYASPIFKPGSQGWFSTGATLGELLNKIGGIIEDFQESWSIEPEEGNGNTPITFENSKTITRAYRLTRNISAKGKDLTQYECHYTGDKHKLKAVNQARDYVIKYIANGGSSLNHHDDYTAFFGTNIFGSGALNLNTSYVGYNHFRTENVGITDGTYSLQDTWILSSGNAHENYNMSFSSAEGSPRNNVSIQGTIKGLTSIPSSGIDFGGNCPSLDNTAYENALNKYRYVTNNGLFGPNAHTFKRANAAAGGGIILNHVPLSVSLATNEFTGEINYTIEYDDRPRNFINGAISENISVTDTYPGDVFAIIPVLGRRTGPILQYIGGRTEYQRSLSIEITVEPRRPPPLGLITEQIIRSNTIVTKPSIVNPTRDSIKDVVNAYSPVNEAGIRKYFASPPQETWDPKEGRYTLNVTWTYELNN